MDPELKDVVFTEEVLKEVDGILSRYPDKRSALLPVLNLAQREFGWISESIMVYVAGLLELTPPKVFEVVTFYTMFNQRPVGKYLIQFCRTLSCAITGGESLAAYLQKKLEIRMGETTSDGLFTLRMVECLASCGTGPMMQINNTYYESLTVEKIDRILEDLKAGKLSPPKAMAEN